MSLRNKLMETLMLLALGWCGAAAQTGENSEGRSRSVSHDYDPPRPGSYSLPVIKVAGDGKVLDAAGKSFQLREVLHGRVTVMSFIYTRCAAVGGCPRAAGVLSELHRISASDGELASSLQLVSLSFDPVGDTPSRMAGYSRLAEGRASASEWRFFTTPSKDALEPILEAYGQVVERRANPADPAGPLNHVLRVFLVDGQGRVRNIYSSGTLDARLVLADVRTLLLERAQRSGRE